MRLQLTNTEYPQGHWLAGDPSNPQQLMAAVTQHSYAPKHEPFEFCSGEIEVQHHGASVRQYSFQVSQEHASESAARVFDLLVEQSQPWHGILHLWVPVSGGQLHHHLSTTTDCVVTLQSLRVGGIGTTADYTVTYSQLTDHGQQPLPVVSLSTEDGDALLTEDGDALEPDL